MAERNPSKQRRAAENKAQREALAARRAKAAEPKPERAAAPADASADAPADEAAGQPERRRSRFRPGPAKTESGRPSRSAPSRPAAAGAATGGRGTKPAPALGPDAPEQPGWRGFLAHVQQVPGGKAVLFAVIFSVVAAGTLLFGSVVQQSGGVAAARVVNEVVGGDPPKDAYDEATSTENVTLLEAAGPIGIAFAALPIIICGVALDATRRPNRRRTFTIAAFALGIYVVLFSFIGIFYFFSMAALFFAAYQARKADPPVRVPRGRPADDAEPDDEG